MPILKPAEHHRRSRCVAATLLLLATGCLLHAGCSRPFWRQQADEDTYDVVAEKVADERWDVPRIDVTADPRSRFFNPYDPDCEPLPPDDPAAHQYMHWLAGKSGYKSWHKFGDAFSVENPQWLNQFRVIPADEEAVLDSDGLPIPALYDTTLVEAIELANIHSRDYQTQIENLYLTALRLTLSRFQFDVRYLGFGGEPSADLTYSNDPGGRESVALGTRFGVSQLLPSGGQWIVELANNTLWMFSGGNQTSSASVLSYSLVQPLLLGAGRRVVLEDLTQGERDVLYAARDLARFRQVFFVDTVSDYLDLVLQLQSVLNQRGNIGRLAEQTEIQRAQESQVPQELSELLPNLPEELVPEDPTDPATPGIRRPPELEGLRYDPNAQALYWRGPMTPQQEQLLRELSDDVEFQAAVTDLIQRLSSEVVTLRVAQLETQLVQSRNRLRSAEQMFQDQLDRYKVQRLGLPPDLPMTIDESLLLPFQLIDPVLPEVEQTVKDFVFEWARLNDQNPDLADLRVVVDGLAELEETVASQALTIVQQDFEKAANLLAGISAESVDGAPRRFETEQERLRVESDVANDRRLFTTIQNDLRRVRQEIQTMRELVSREKLPISQKREIYRRIAEIREETLRISQSLQVIQIGLRVELISIQPFTMTIEDAVQAGIDNRLDLMNARARVMDARRAIEVQANRLEAVLNVRIEGDVRTADGTDPFDFRSDNSSFRAGLAFTAPLDQIAERNAYRAALIDYQRARRDYMAAEDQVKLSIRGSWRRLQVLQRNFEDSRVNVRLAALQYDNAVEAASAPQVGGGGGGGGSALDLLRALDDTLSAQQNLISNWINYEQNRLNIYRDMGMMEIDARGIWDDSYYQAKANREIE